MAFEAYKHPKVKKVYFIPRRNPVEVTDEDKAVTGDSLAELVGELEPVRLEIVEVGARDADDAADDKEPASSKAKARPASKKVMVVEETDGEKEPATWLAECPSCGEGFHVAGEVERFRCPG